MTLLRTLAVLGLSLTAQAQTASTLPNSRRNNPCDALHCEVDSFCLIDATGAAFCEKYQTMNHTQDPCAKIECQPDHFCNIDATGVAFCEKYQTMNHTQDPCAKIECQPDHFCNIDATGVAFCEKYQTMNHTQDPCAALKCDTDHFCNIDATGAAFCDKSDPLRDASVLQSGHVDVAPVVPASVPAVASTSVDASASGVVLPLASALSLLCLGGLVAILVHRKRTPETVEADIEMLA